MNFALSDAQEELRRSVRELMEQTSSSAEVRRLMATAEGYDPSTWGRMAELGLQGLAIPRRHGGAGLTAVELLVVSEEMGRWLFCGPYLSTVVLTAGAVMASGDEAAGADLLPRIATGEVIATLAVTGESGRWDGHGVDVTATRSAGGYLLDGVASFVVDGHVATMVLVVARTGEGLSLFAATGDAPGLVRTALPTMDQTRKQARMELSATPARLIGAEGRGWVAVRRALDLAAVALAAEQVGGAQRCLELSVRHAKERSQFGRPIGSFQAIKHKCAEMLLDVESARSAAYYAAWTAAQDDDVPSMASMASMAKAYCSEAYFRAAAETIQIHGGVGFTWENDAHLYFKRAKSSALLFGDPAYHRERLAQLVIDSEADAPRRA